ncbi:hypothetical protein LV476_05215 [Guyparkeria hydrothermalis]|uniref:hypothetical protein n=1 Tax=Guyparkeria hydrothermalis TaxID=923 RepID=UPI002021FB75|nr:hypothetical protein [Guyparkeria hydrothermalis]MCL7744351.1 hypothetical protein [Guyparkeria hydrothermalis]
MQQADERATDLAQRWDPAVSSFFSRYTLLPRALELLPSVRNIPTSASPESANSFLSTLASRLELDAVYVIGPSGTTAASSNENFVGENTGSVPISRTP